MSFRIIIAFLYLVVLKILSQNITSLIRLKKKGFTVHNLNSKVQFMNDNKIFKTDDHFEVLRKIDKNSKISQRKLAEQLGFSLGKLNYCLKALQNKGLVKIKNFGKKKNKVRYIQYILTPRGISERTKLTISFMKRKIQEYDELKSELEKNKKNVDNN